MTGEVVTMCCEKRMREVVRAEWRGGVVRHLRGLVVFSLVLHARAPNFAPSVLAPHLAPARVSYLSLAPMSHRLVPLPPCSDTVLALALALILIITVDCGEVECSRPFSTPPLKSSYDTRLFEHHGNRPVPRRTDAAQFLYSYTRFL